jgi:hypothetical protein
MQTRQSVSPPKFDVSYHTFEHILRQCFVYDVVTNSSDTWRMQNAIERSLDHLAGPKNLKQSPKGS